MGWNEGDPVWHPAGMLGLRMGSMRTLSRDLKNQRGGEAKIPGTVSFSAAVIRRYFDTNNAY
jgi:hypothetical protein